MIHVLSEVALMALGELIAARRRRVAFGRWLRTTAGRSSWWKVAAR